MLPYAPWLCWLIPIIGSGLTPLSALAHRKLRHYAPTMFVMATIVFSFSMRQTFIERQLIELAGK